MRKSVFWLTILFLCFGSTVFAQIDPEKRRLFQLGYNQPIEGRGPLAGYAFYYDNRPNFLDNTNLTLRLAIAPVYIDSELGFAQALGEQTDLAVGLAGGGFADSYSEVQEGKLFEDQSFTGNGGEISSSVYHLFNPNQLIPLSAILRGSMDYAAYVKDSHTSNNFELPPNRATFNVRAGLRWGGREPVMRPDLGMELSAWYEGQFRTAYGKYGFDDDREVEPSSHLFWARALLIYTLTECKHNFSLSLTAGTSISADRFSAYRIGGALPLISEFPLTLPGYYYQELSAHRFILFSGQYSLPLDAAKRWNLTGLGTVAGVDYISGLQQPGNFNSGAGLGVGYRSKNNTWEVNVSYNYGFDAIRHHGRGAQNIGVIFQYDFEKRQRGPILDVDSPYKSRGLFRIFGD